MRRRDEVAGVGAPGAERPRDRSGIRHGSFRRADRRTRRSSLRRSRTPKRAGAPRVQSSPEHTEVRRHRRRARERRGPRQPRRHRSTRRRPASIVPLCAAAKSIGARSFSASDPQNAASSGDRPLSRCTEQSDAATLRAPNQVVAANERRPARPPSARYSKRVVNETAPTRARSAAVEATRSVFTLVATTGPSQSRIAGIARPVVFPDCVGPTTSSE